MALYTHVDKCSKHKTKDVKAHCLDLKYTKKSENSPPFEIHIMEKKKEIHMLTCALADISPRLAPTAKL